MYAYINAGATRGSPIAEISQIGIYRRSKKEERRKEKKKKDSTTVQETVRATDGGCAKN